MARIVLALACWLSTIVSLVAAEPFGPELRQRALRATVTLTCPYSDMQRLGTGVIVGRQTGDLIVLTAHHVIADAERISVRFWPHTTAAPMSHDVETIAESRASDLALLRVGSQQPPPDTLAVPADAPPSEAEFPVLSVGSSLGQVPTCETTQVVERWLRSDEHGKAWYWVTSDEPEQGRSGGPLIDSAGRLLGICSRGSPGRGIYSGWEEIHALWISAGLDETLPSPAPPPSIASITAATLALGPARWTNLAEGWATFDALVRVSVRGPLGDRTLLGLTAPPGVQALRLSHNVIRPGDQTIRIRVLAAVSPAPRATELVFQLAATSTESAPVQVAAPLRMTVTGPKPCRLALAANGAPSARIETILRNDGPAFLTLCPVVLDAPTAKAAEGLLVHIKSGSAIRVDAQPLRPSVSVQIPVCSTQALPALSFFTDTLVEAPVAPIVLPDCGAVVPCRQTLVLRAEAPFKRLAAWFAAGAFVLALIFLPLRLFLRLG